MGKLYPQPDFRKVVKRVQHNGHDGPSGLVPSPVQFVPKGGRMVKRGKNDVPKLLNVAGIQRFLKNRGYDIQIDGKLGPITKAAMADFFKPGKIGGAVAAALSKTHVTGARDPKAFNKRYGPVGPGGRSVVSLGPKQTLDRHGNGRPGNREQQQPVGGPSVNFNSPDLRQPLPTVVPDSLANSGAQLLPKNLAEALAGNEFDSAIHDAQLSQAHQGADAKQNAEDIRHWYDQVLASQATAAGRDADMAHAAEGSVGDANKAILASLGGHANDAAGMVAAQGADNLGTLKAQDVAQAEYNSDIAPLLKAEGAGASTREAARQSQLAAQLAQQVSDLMHQKGSSVAQHMMDIAQYNNGVRDQRLQNLLNVKQFNAGQEQQAFSNAMALQQAKEAAILGGAKVAASMGSKGPAKGSFGYSSTSDRVNYTKDVLSRIAPNGQIPDGMTPTQARVIAQRLATIYFPGGGVKGSGIINSVLTQAGY